MGVGEVILIAACAAIVIGVIAAKIVSVVKGKPHCSGDCCSCCAACVKAAKNKKRGRADKTNDVLK